MDSNLRNATDEAEAGKEVCTPAAAAAASADASARTVGSGVDGFEPLSKASGDWTASLRRLASPAVLKSSRRVVMHKRRNG